MKVSIDSLTTGDVLTVKALTVPFVDHVGIVVVDSTGAFVYHNTPTQVNEFGGSIIKEPLSIWLANREFIRVDSTGISADHIRWVVNQLKNEPFNLLSFNCEHFANLVVSGEKASRQLQMWTVAAGVVAFQYGKKGN